MNNIFKPNDRVIFVDTEVTFLSYFGEKSALIRFEENDEELIGTNMKGEAYVSSRLLRAKNGNPSEI